MEEEILISGSAVLNILPALLVGIGIGILWGGSKPKEKAEKIANRCFLGAFAVILVIGFSL